MSVKDFIHSKLATYSKSNASLIDLIKQLDADHELNYNNDSIFKLNDCGYTNFLVNLLAKEGYSVSDDWIELMAGPTLNEFDLSKVIERRLSNVDFTDPDYIAIPDYANEGDRFDQVHMMWFLKDMILIKVHSQGENQGYRFLVPYKLFK